MDLRLKRERVEFLSCLIHRSTEDAFTSDAVIRDTLPDADEVVFTNGDFCLWRLDLSNGMAECEGEWKGSVCYCAEETGVLCSFPVSVGVRMRIHDDKIVPELKPYASFQVTELSAQLMNSRKIRVRVRVKMTLRAYQADELEYSTDVEDMSEDLFQKTEKTSCSVITSVEEQVFTAADSLKLRSLPQDGILAAGSEVIAEAPMRSGSRAVVRGHVATHLLYQSEEQATPVYETIETPFSQLLDIHDDIGNETLMTGLQLTSSSIHLTEDGTLETEFHIVAQTICAHELQISALTDVYSVADSLTLEPETMVTERWIAQETVITTAEVAVSNSKEISGVIASSAQLRSFQKTESGYSGTVTIAALSQRTDGRLVEFRTEAPLLLEVISDCEVYDLQIALPEVTLAGEQVRVQISVAAQTVTAERKNTACLRSVSREGPDPMLGMLPSLTLKHIEEDEDLWSVAKQYASSVAAIQAANPQLSEGTGGGLCLIPRIVVG